MNPYNLNFMKNIRANTAGRVYRQRDCRSKYGERRGDRRLSTLNIYTCFYERENEFKNKRDIGFAQNEISITLKEKCA